MSEVLGTVGGVAAGATAVVGALLFLASAIGLLRFPDFYTRVHAPTKAATLGLMLIGVGSLIRNLGADSSALVQDALLVVFFMLTMPVSAQVLVRAAAASKVPHDPRTRGEPPEAAGPVS
jgi:multicomponent K+:H+ antiporter subunit G